MSLEQVLLRLMVWMIAFEIDYLWVADLVVGWMRAQRRVDSLVPEAGSDFVAAFTVCETPSARWNRVNVILHESQFCCMTRTPHRIHMRAPCMMCMLHDLFRIH